MPARNIYHDAVVTALIADGWTITDDPLTIRVGTRDLFIDLAAERNALGAEKNGETIAVEIIAVEVQSFLNPSEVRSLQEALGQYEMYRFALKKKDPDRPLFLAVPKTVYNGILSEELGQIVLSGANISVLVFDPDEQKVIQWIK